MDTLEKNVMKAIKQKAALLGVTQSDLAQRLGVSLITMKRWYSGKGIKLTNLNQICHFLNLDLSQMIKEAEAPEIKNWSYTLTQESALALEPKLLALFDLIIGGAGLSHIKKKYKLDDKKLMVLLLKLDKLHLIELHTGNKIKLIHSGEPTWIINGPLSKKFRSKMIDELLGDHDKTDTKFFIHDYLEEDIEQVKKKLNELEIFMFQSNKRAAQRPEEVKSFGSYITFKEYEWNVRAYLEN